MADSTHSVVALIGGGGHALVVAEAARSAGWTVRGFYDDDPNAVLGLRGGVTRLGGLTDIPPGQHLVMAIGGIALRRRVLESHQPLLAAAPVIISSRAYVSPSAKLDAGTVVMPGAVVHSLAKVHAHAIINTGAIIEHECVIGENTHVAPGSALGGNVLVDRDTLLGIGCRVLPGLKVGRGCVVGGGAVVIRDVADGEQVVGVPARGKAE